LSNPKPLLSRVPLNELSDQLFHAREKSVELRGDGTFFEVMGHNIDLYNWYIDRFYKELFYSKRLDLKLKELLRLKLSTLHGCKFCNQGNTVDATAAGVPIEQIKELHNYQAGQVSDKEKSVLELTDQMALQNPTGKLSKSLYDKLTLHFSDAEILELGMIMGLLSGVAKFIFAFDLVEKEESCPL